MEETRDRPHVRHIYIERIDESRLKEILGNIARKNVIKARTTMAGSSKVRYKVKIKQQELLMIQLSLTEKIEVHRCAPAPYKRSPFKSAFLDLNDIPGTKWVSNGVFLERVSK